MQLERLSQYVSVRKNGKITPSRRRAISPTYFSESDADESQFIHVNRRKATPIQESDTETDQSELDEIVDDFIDDIVEPGTSGSVDSSAHFTQDMDLPFDDDFIDWTNLEFEKIVGKRRDCRELIYTKHEKQIYGRNRALISGEVAYLCRLYGNKGIKCKSRLYLFNGRLFKGPGFIAHNHPTQEKERFDFEVESDIKQECGNLNSLVSSNSQVSAVSGIFQKHMKV